MSKTSTLLCTLAASLLAGNSAFSQRDSIATGRLDDVVVTANRVSLKQSQTGKIVTVIDQKMIANSQGRTVMELLNTQPGFFHQWLQ